MICGTHNLVRYTVLLKLNINATRDMYLVHRLKVISQWVDISYALGKEVQSTVSTDYRVPIRLSKLESTEALLAQRTQDTAPVHMSACPYARTNHRPLCPRAS